MRTCAAAFFECGGVCIWGLPRIIVILLVRTTIVRLILHAVVMKFSVILRFLIVGALWAAVCVWFVARLVASGAEITLLSLFPVVASAFIVFVPLYKKYVRNDGKKGFKK